MKKETFSVFFACAMGALIGAFASLEFAAHLAYGKYFWAFGALLGGLTAYGIVDFAEFRAGVARAYRETLDFRPDWEGWKTLALTAAGTSTAMFTAWIVIELIGASLRQTAVFDLSSPQLLEAIEVGVTLTLSVMAIFLVMEACSMCEGGDFSFYDQEKERKFYRNLLKHTNLVSAAYWTLYGVWYLLRLTPAFAKRTFVYVHSDRRTICFVDAALGATAGYFYGSAILGALIGGLLGALNYEVVSVRWLKLVSVKS